MGISAYQMPRSRGQTIAEATIPNMGAREPRIAAVKEESQTTFRDRPSTLIVQFGQPPPEGAMIGWAIQAMGTV
jgi:dihydrodipicolinate synthase/N-acetylneuraminate lyase